MMEEKQFHEKGYIQKLFFVDKKDLHVQVDLTRMCFQQGYSFFIY